jgi:hypothetical protein
MDHVEYQSKSHLAIDGLHYDEPVSEQIAETFREREVKYFCEKC